MKARIGNRIVRKLRSVRGETIAEVLVSTLIGALAVLMLAMAISVSSRIVADNRAKMDLDYSKSNGYAEGVNDPSENDFTIKSVLISGSEEVLHLVDGDGSGL